MSAFCGIIARILLDRGRPHDGRTIQHRSFPSEGHARPNLPPSWHHGGICLEISLRGFTDEMVCCWHKAADRILTTGRRFRGIADVAGSAACPGPVRLTHGTRRTAPSKKGLHRPELSAIIPI